MSRFFKKILFWIILMALLLGAVLFINSKIENNKNSENNPSQKIPQSPNSDNPTDNPEPIPPIDTENWWLTDEEIEYAYQEIRKEITNSPEIQLVSPSVVRVIQQGGEISEELKKAKIIFFPINNSESHETGDSGSHWTLLVFQKDLPNEFSHLNSFGSSVPANARKLAENFCKKLNVEFDNSSIFAHKGAILPTQQTNGADCGIFVIAFTRTLVKRWQEKLIRYESGDEWIKTQIREKDLIFPISEERQKLKAAGFPKKGSPGKDYDIGDDVDYYEREENLILEWWGKLETPLQRRVGFDWLSSLTQQELTKASDFKEFSKKVRLLSGKNLEKEKLNQVYHLKKILKACSLSLEEYKRTKSFNGKDNFREDRITAEESQFVRENINKETVKEINELYNNHFPGK